MFKSLRFTATEGIFKPPMCLLPLNQQTRHYPCCIYAYVHLCLMQQHFKWAITHQQKGPWELLFVSCPGQESGAGKDFLYLHHPLLWYDLTQMRHIWVGLWAQNKSSSDSIQSAPGWHCKHWKNPNQQLFWAAYKAASDFSHIQINQTK